MPSLPSPSTDSPLACPRCAKTFPLSERFCGDCGMPLVFAGRTGEEPITEAHERARNQAMAEMIQGMLLEEGIPSFLKRTRGFDAPEFLAGGPRDVFVPGEALEVARDVLAGARSGVLEEGEDGQPGNSTEGRPGGRAALDFPRSGDDGAAPSPVRLLAWILVAVAVAALIVWLLYLAAT